MNYYMGLDVGGTSIKGLVINEKGDISSEGCVPVEVGADLADTIEVLADELVQRMGVVFSQISGIGVCCPGLIDTTTGTVLFAGNFELKNYPLKKLLVDKFKLRVEVCNDANAAALGEAKFGVGKGYDNSIMITLGTGVGGGIVIDGKLFEGNKGAGTEVGHMVIEKGGLKCTCGRRGCFEVYCSARALTAKTKFEMEEDTGSDMWKTYTNDTAAGKTEFEPLEGNTTATRVVDWYINHLACGITNLANIFRPNIVMLGGGVAAQGSRLTAPLQKLVDKELFGGTDFAPVKIECASLGNRAGAYGAAALLF